MITAQTVVDSAIKAKNQGGAANKAWATRYLNQYLDQEVGKGRDRNRVAAGIKAQVTKQSA